MKKVLSLLLISLVLSSCGNESNKEQDRLIGLAKKTKGVEVLYPENTENFMKIIAKRLTGTTFIIGNDARYPILFKENGNGLSLIKEEIRDDTGCHVRRTYEINFISKVSPKKLDISLQEIYQLHITTKKSKVLRDKNKTGTCLSDSLLSNGETPYISIENFAGIYLNLAPKKYGQYYFEI